MIEGLELRWSNALLVRLDIRTDGRVRGAVAVPQVAPEGDLGERIGVEEHVVHPHLERTTDRMCSDHRAAIVCDRENNTLTKHPPQTLLELLPRALMNE